VATASQCDGCGKRALSGKIGYVIRYRGRPLGRILARRRAGGSQDTAATAVARQPVDGSPASGPRNGSAGLDDDTAELFLGSELRLLTAAPPIPSGGPQVWRLDPMVERGPDLLSRFGERRLEMVALAALTAGTLLLSFVGLVLGLVLVTLSRFWDLRDKLVMVLVLPAGTIFGGIVLAWLRATRIDPVPDTGLRLDRALDTIAMTVQAMPLLVGWLAAAYLGYCYRAHREVTNPPVRHGRNVDL
jgi:hypothetical protein